MREKFRRVGEGEKGVVVEIEGERIGCCGLQNRKGEREDVRAYGLITGKEWLQSKA